MTWIYFSSQILFLGAEFTEVYARRHGSRKPHVAPEYASAVVAEVVRASRAAPAPSQAERRVANATGTGLLVGLIGGVLAALAALAVGTFKAVAPLTRRLRR
jgi:hypothetical protein